MPEVVRTLPMTIFGLGRLDGGPITAGCIVYSASVSMDGGPAENSHPEIPLSRSNHKTTKTEPLIARVAPKCQLKDNPLK